MLTHVLIEIVDEFNETVHHNLSKLDVEYIPQLVLQTDGMCTSIKILNWVLWSDCGELSREYGSQNSTIDDDLEIIEQIKSEIRESFLALFDIITLLNETIEEGL